MILKRFASLFLFLAVVAVIGCDNSSSPNDPNDPGVDPNATIRISPSAVSLDSKGRATVDVLGGEAPFSWTVSDPGLGTVRGESPNSRRATYQRTGRGSGINTITVRDNYGSTASASVIADALRIAPAGATLATNVTSQIYVVEGGTPPFTWGVSGVALGTIASTGERSAIYIRRQGSGSTEIFARDALGSQTSTIVTQE